MSPITVSCDLFIYEADLTSKYPSLNLSGVVVLRIRSRYQLLIKTEKGAQFPVDDVTTPELCSSFVIPTVFLYMEVSELYVEKKLLDLGFDDKACKFLVPKISEFAVSVAERRKEGKQGYVTVAAIGILKADYIEKQELAKIARNLKGFGEFNVVNGDSDFFNGKSDLIAEINDNLSLE
ncbi:hypothetical protein REPUB_Repub08aG0058600 [Reevesia pubescens]